MSIMKERRVNEDVTLFGNYNQYGDLGLYLEADEMLLLLSDGEIDYIIEGIDHDHAYDFVDMCDNEPSDSTWEKYVPDFDDPDDKDDFFSSVYDRESFADLMKQVGVIPKNAKVSCDVEGPAPLMKFIRNLLKDLY